MEKPVTQGQIQVRSIVILISVVLTVTAGGFLVVYQQTLDGRKAQLQELVRSQARLMEAIGKFDAFFHSGSEEGASMAATLSQIKEAHRKYTGFGETGELVLAQRREHQIEFLLPVRSRDFQIPPPVPWEGELAGPMRLALSGESGVVEALDHSSNEVLAAYEYLPFLELGLVAKIDKSEILTPFTRAAEVSGVIALIAIGIATLLNIRSVGPLIRNVTEREQNIRTLASRGRIVMGRLLDENVVQHLGRTTRLDVVAHEWNAVDLPPDVESAKDELSSKTPTSIQLPRDDLAHGYLLIDDIYGEPAVILKATMDREIYLSGKSTIEFHIVQLLMGGLVCVLICVLFLDRTVLARLTRLVSQVNQIREDRSIRMESPGNDEISVLARQMNVMLTAVEQAEANLREANQSLERRVEERTQELAGLNRQLESEMAERKAAQREAEEHAEVAEKANHAKSAFLANISHEVRTPMNAILGYSDILQRALTDPQQRGYLSSIDSSGRTLISLLESILDFSRLQSGDLVLDTSAMQVRSLIADLDRSFESEAEAKGLSYSSSIAENIPDVVLMDESRVRQVLLNLVGNAIKFTGSGTVTLQVTASEDASGATIGFSIRDTGIGIAPDQQERIFGAFDQQAGQSINEYGGTGMGLALSRGLATLMNGEITVASELGAGSEFTVTIPGVEVITRPTAPQQIETDQGQVSIDAELSDDTISRLPDLLQRLQSQTATLDSLTETLTINDLESFARSMSSMGREFDYPPLENWANILAEQVRGFDMDAIPHTLQAYLDVQEAIRARVGR